MKNRGCVADAFLERFFERLERFWSNSDAKCGQGTDLDWASLATIFHQKSIKWQSKKHPKIDAEKVMKIDAKSFENEAKIDAKINDFHAVSKRAEMHEIIVLIS